MVSGRLTLKKEAANNVDPIPVSKKNVVKNVASESNLSQSVKSGLWLIGETQAATRANSKKAIVSGADIFLINSERKLSNISKVNVPNNRIRIGLIANRSVTVSDPFMFEFPV